MPSTELSVVITPRTLLYDEACRMIAQLHEIDDVKDMIDKVAALEEYSHRAQNYDLEKQAFEIRKRAERKAGELLKEMAKEGKRRKKGPAKNPNITDGKIQQKPKTLQELSITPRQSMEWQQLASLSEQVFEETIAKSVEGLKPSSNVVKLALKKPRTKPVRRKPMISTEPEQKVWLQAAAWEDFIKRLVEGVSPTAFPGEILEHRWRDRLKKDITAARLWLYRVEDLLK